MRTIAIIPAGGAGHRFGGDTPKQYLALGGRPIFELTLERFEQAEAIHGCILVVAEDHVERLSQSLPQKFAKLLKVVAGGETRQMSVANGVRAIEGECAFIAVHDAARPLVDVQTINQCVAVARESGAAIAAMPARDTVKQVAEGDVVSATLTRQSIWLAQTPQVIRHGLYLRALKHAEAEGLEGTDEAALVEAIGGTVAVVLGNAWNIKITTPEDLRVAEMLV